MATAKKTTAVPLLQKLNAISEGMGFLTFDKKNTGQGYEYASSAGVIRKLQGLLIKHKVHRHCMHREFSFIPGESMKGNMCNTQAVWNWVCTETSESITTKSCGQGKDSSDKGMGKAQTNDNKYDIAHTLCLAWGADDPDSAPYKEPKKPKVAAKDVVASITAAKTMKALEATKADLLQLTGEEKASTKALYVTKKESFSA